MAGSMGSTRAETMVVGLAETKDFQTGWHLDLKMAGSSVAKKAADWAPKLDFETGLH